MKLISEINCTLWHYINRRKCVETTINLSKNLSYELHKYRFEPHGGNEEKVTLLTLNGTNYWGETGLTVQKPTLFISNHNYH